MKYIRTFEELSPNIYRKVGNIIKGKNPNSQRGNDLITHANDIENKKQLKPNTKSIYPFDIININGQYKVNLSYIELSYYLVNDVDDYEDADIEDIMQSFKRGRKRSLSIFLSCTFSDYNGDDYSIFLEIMLINNSQFKFDILFNCDEIEPFTFANRKSANLFVKSLKDYLDNIPIEEIILLSEIDIKNQSKNLILFKNITNEIDIHMLYDSSYIERTNDISILK